MAPCWRSIQRLSQPIWAISSADTEEGIASHPFTTLPPSAQIRRILFSRMIVPRCCAAADSSLSARSDQAELFRGSEPAGSPCPGWAGDRLEALALAGYGGDTAEGVEAGIVSLDHDPVAQLRQPFPHLRRDAGIEISLLALAMEAKASNRCRQAESEIMPIGERMEYGGGDAVAAGARGSEVSLAILDGHDLGHGEDRHLARRYGIGPVGPRIEIPHAVVEGDAGAGGGDLRTEAVRDAGQQRRHIALGVGGGHLAG